MKCIYYQEPLAITISVLFPHKRGGFVLFHLFGVTSGLFLARPSTCYNLFQVAPFVTNDDLQNVLNCKFIKNELYVRYCYKMR